MAVTIKKSNQNIGAHYVISVNGEPVKIAFTKKEAEKTASKLRNKPMSNSFGLF